MSDKEINDITIVEDKPDDDMSKAETDEIIAEPRPCEHNDWDDVRTRKGYKVLRCVVCQEKWKLPSPGVMRCMEYLHNCCTSEHCEKLHVRRKKSSIEERYYKFGDKVLVGVHQEDIRSNAKSLLPTSELPTKKKTTLDTSDQQSVAATISSSCSTSGLSAVSSSDSVINPYMSCFAPKRAATSRGGSQGVCGWTPSYEDAADKCNSLPARALIPQDMYDFMRPSDDSSETTSTTGIGFLVGYW